MDRALLVGAQASEPKGVTIWRIFRQYFINSGLPMDYALFSSYDALDRALLNGEIDLAWNGPMAQAQVLIQSQGACRVLAMRDTDREVSTLLLARADSPIKELADLRGKRIAFGSAISSEQALIPKYQLRQEGFNLETDCELVELAAKEYPDGERWVDALTIIAAIEDRTVDVGAIFEPLFNFFVERGRLDPAAFQVVWRSRPFSHCGFAARPDLPEETSRRFVEVLTSMDYTNPDVKEMMDLEYLRGWVPADESGWQDLVAAVKEAELVGVTY